MKELAPQTKDGSYARPTYNLKGVIGSPEFPVRHPSQEYQNPACMLHDSWEESMLLSLNRCLHT